VGFERRSVAADDWFAARSHDQSGGTSSIPHQLPAVSSSKPNSQIFSCSPRQIQFMTRALIVARAGRPFNSTMAPFLTGRVQRTAHPRRLTSITWHASENGSSGLKLVSVIGSSQGTRVPPRVRAVLRDELTGGFSKAHHCRILVWLTCDCYPRSQFVTASSQVAFNPTGPLSAGVRSPLEYPLGSNWTAGVPLT
jgi:hypothetical protein